MWKKNCLIFLHFFSRFSFGLFALLCFPDTTPAQYTTENILFALIFVIFTDFEIRFVSLLVQNPVKPLTITHQPKPMMNYNFTSAKNNKIIMKIRKKKLICLFYVQNRVKEKESEKNMAALVMLLWKTEKTNQLHL